MHTVVKMKARYYKDLEFMYEDLGLVKIEDGKKTVNPSNVYISSEDYKKMKKTLKEKFKKQNEFSSNKKIEQKLGFYLLNLGPNENMCKGVRPGYLIIVKGESDE